MVVISAPLLALKAPRAIPAMRTTRITEGMAIASYKLIWRLARTLPLYLVSSQCLAIPKRNFRLGKFRGLPHASSDCNTQPKR